MKRGSKLIMFLLGTLVFLLVWLTCIYVYAADVTLAWDPVDFAICASDPSKSGYRIYKSLDEGLNKVEVGSVASTETTFVYPEPEDAKFCYYATAFNQVGSSDYSEPACGYVSSTEPGIPTGLKVLIEKIISLLQGYVRDNG